MSIRRDHPVLEALGIVALLGMLGAVERLLHFHLDVSQRWAWAVASSVLLACAMALRSRDGLGRYALLAAVASTAVFVSRFGAHSRWASEMLNAYVP